MSASVLLVGKDNFTDSFKPQLSAIAELTVTSVMTPELAQAALQAQSSEIVLMEANHPDNGPLCQWIRQNRQLAWVYCIILSTDEAVNKSDELVPHQPRELNQQWAEALEAGADAYLQLSHPQSADWGIAQANLLRAQLRAGLRRVKVARDLTRANELLSAIALVDPLTQLSNRRAFDWELPRLVKATRSHHSNLSLMMVDIDYFKVVNDTYGHLVGDRALHLVADRLRHNTRFSDTPFRYGGEEFVVLLSHTNAAEALAIGKRFCQLIGNQPFQINDTLSLDLTVSIGIASLEPEDDPKGLSLLDRADHNLLRAKEHGRNQVVTDPAVEEAELS